MRKHAHISDIGVRWGGEVSPDKGGRGGAEGDNYVGSSRYMAEYTFSVFFHSRITSRKESRLLYS